MKFLRTIWNRLFVRDTAFTSRYQRLKLLYALEDPWSMSTPKERHRFAKTNELVINQIGPIGTVLEVGCGEGHQTEFIQMVAESVTGIDLSATAIARAKRRCPDVNFRVCNAENLEEALKDASFDLIMLCEVLYYSKDPSQIVKTCQQHSDHILVTNFSERAGALKPEFSHAGWRRLDDIVYEDTVWECHVWTRASH